MRRASLFAFVACLSACGGAAEQASPKAAAASSPDQNDSDTGFADYAAAHGIATLNGGRGEDETPEVTADGLRLEQLDKDKPIKLDGVPAEWPPFAKANVVIQGTGAKVSMGIALQYDDAKLYVGADVKDASFAVGEDHVSLVLAIPLPRGGYATREISLYAGKPGESEGSVRYGKGRAVPGARIVEAPSDGGYTIEATVPWSALPEMRATRVGIHGVARYVDGSGIIATGPGDERRPRSMPWVPSEPELSMIEQLLAPRGLTKTAPAAELVADLTGDGTSERVAVFDHLLTICGASYLGGTGFFFRDLGDGVVVKLDARRATGRVGADVVVQRQGTVGDATRQYVEVLTAMNNTDPPQVTFAHEIEVAQGPRRIDNAIRIARGEIDVTAEPAAGWNATSYSEPIASDVAPILLPWAGVHSQMWRWDGKRFTETSEVAQREQVYVKGRPSGTVMERLPPHPPEPPTPEVGRGKGMATALLDQYRKDRGVEAGAAPKVDLKVQVSGDARPERVLLIGRDVVVLGPGFKGGTGYAYITLSQFADAGDVTGLSARDLTGDGDADLVVRGVRHVRSSSGDVLSELLFVYQVTGDAITRVFGIETGRELGKKRVQGLVQFIPAPGNKTFDVLSAPGRAFGWTEKTYPFAQDTPGSGDIEPLLLPWGGVSSVRYRWDGSTFTKTEE